MVKLYILIFVFLPVARVTFKFDKGQDLFHHWLTSRIKSGENKSFHTEASVNNMNKDVFRICNNRKFDECKGELDDFLTSKYYNNSIFKMYIGNLNRAWASVESEFFKRMDKIMDVEFDCRIRAYIHTGIYGSATYKKRLFVISVRRNLFESVVSCGHEIMHLYFRRFYFDTIKDVVGEHDARLLNESLTVLLNEEFKDLWVFNDKGYSQHQEFRKFIAESWNEDKDFKVLMSKCIGYLLAKK